jgi:hypothetical protein
MQQQHRSPAHRLIFAVVFITAMAAGYVLVSFWLGRQQQAQAVTGGLTADDLDYLRFLAYFEDSRRQMEREQAVETQKMASPPRLDADAAQRDGPPLYSQPAMAQFVTFAQQWRQMHQRFLLTPLPSAACQRIATPYAQALDVTATAFESRAKMVTASAQRARQGLPASGPSTVAPNARTKAKAGETAEALYAQANRALDELRDGRDVVLPDDLANLCLGGQ